MHRIHTIDLNYLGVAETIACYVVEGPDSPVLIETGPASCLEALERGLSEIGLALADIRHALVTHIHLDHAGAAGHLTERSIKVHVHAFGAPHLIDPAKLIASATRIYGDQMDRLWGSIVPARAANIIAVNDGDTIDVEGLRFTAIETPGHARHHHAFMLQDEDGSICFTGDVAGMIIPGLRFINLPTPPPEFDLEQWLQSVARLEAGDHRVLYPTHFGPIDTPAAHLTATKQALRSHTDFIRGKLAASVTDNELHREYARWVREQAAQSGASEQQVRHFVSDNLLRMNVTGIVRYLTKIEGVGRR